MNTTSRSGGPSGWEENASEYEVRSAFEITALLRTVQRQKSLITLHFPADNDFLVTSIIDVDTERGDLVFEYPKDVKACQRALRAGEMLMCTTMHNHVKIQFTCLGTRKILYHGRDALCSNLPNLLLRVQRREAFRIDIPAEEPLRCVIGLPPGRKTTTAELMVLDVSSGGISLIDHHPLIRLEPGAIHKRCSLDLPNIGIVTFVMRVKASWPYTLPSGLVCKRAGCQFLHMPESTAAMVQRYIIQLERDRNARRTGLLKEF